MMEQLRHLRQHLLTGVSYVIPFVACGGILIGLSIGIGSRYGMPITSNGPDFSHLPILKLIFDIGSAAFALMLSVLAGYISYSIAGKPGLVPGFVGGYLSGQINAGFLGAILAGLMAGYVVHFLKKLPVPKYLRPVMPILIIPIISAGIIGVIMLKVLGIPIAH